MSDEPVCDVCGAPATVYRNVWMNDDGTPNGGREHYCDDHMPTESSPDVLKPRVAHCDGNVLFGPPLASYIAETCDEDTVFESKEWVSDEPFPWPRHDHS